MPHITIKTYPIKSEQTKKELAQEITNVVMRVAKKPEEAISIAIQEIDESEWMDKVYEKEIRPNLDTLYKKPGY